MAVADAFLFQVSACQGGQAIDPGQEPNIPSTGVGYTIPRGMPTGALANGENAVRKQAYFRKPRYVQVPSLFFVSYIHTAAAGSFSRGWGRSKRRH